MFSPRFIPGIVKTKTAGERPAVVLPEEMWRSANRQALIHYARRDEHQELRLVGERRIVAEQEAEERQLAEERDPGDVGAIGLLVDAADHHRAAVFDQNLGLHVLGIDLHP